MTDTAEQARELARGDVKDDLPTVRVVPSQVVGCYQVIPSASPRAIFWGMALRPDAFRARGYF